MRFPQCPFTGSAIEAGVQLWRNFQTAFYYKKSESRYGLVCHDRQRLARYQNQHAKMVIYWKKRYFPISAESESISINAAGYFMTDTPVDRATSSWINGTWIEHSNRVQKMLIMGPLALDHRSGLRWDTDKIHRLLFTLNTRKREGLIKKMKPPSR